MNIDAVEKALLELPSNWRKYVIHLFCPKCGERKQLDRSKPLCGC
jgi:hypothetical protein